VNHPPSPGNTLEKIALFVDKHYWLIVGFWLLFFFYFVFLTKIYGPYMDDWNQMYFVKAITEGKATLSLLFERFYGAHTPALARIFFSIDYIVFEGTNIFPKVVAFICMAITFILFHKNIAALHLKSTEKSLLNITGLITVFGTSQIYTYNHAWGALQHSPAVLFPLLAMHHFSTQINKGASVSIIHALTYLGLCTISALFTAMGIFGMLIILLGMILYRPVWKTLAVYTMGTIILFYLLKPGLLVIRATESLDAVTLISEQAFLQKMGGTPAPFFFGYSNYLFGFTGTILQPFSLTAAIMTGGVFFTVFAAAGTFLLVRHKKEWVFFQLFLFMLIAYAMVAAWGRYQFNEYQFDRYATLYPWLLWTGCIVTTLVFRKTGLGLCLLICAFTFVTSAHHINYQLLIQRDSNQADVNMINNSFIHMTYQKVSVPLKYFDFKPEIFHDYQKNQLWGIYRRYAIPDLSSIGSDTCEAIKTKDFIVSEKQFVEYQLDGWNVSADHYLPSVYALDENNQVVAQGISMPRKLRWLPPALLSREELMIYIVIPRTYRLSTLRLVGGSKDDWCEITLRKKT